VVNDYLHIDGGKLLFTQYKAGKVQDAIDSAAAAQQQSGATNGAQSLQAGQPEPGGTEQSMPPSETAAQAEPSEQTQG